MSEFTLLLAAIERGEPQATDQLLPLVYHELRQLAAAKLAHEAPGQTLQATALVHEAYLRLVGSSAPKQWDGRGHFFAAAAEAMRRILVENARHKRSLKSGGKLKRQELDAEDLADPSVSGDREQLLALDDALTALAAKDPTKAELVKLRYFAGLTTAQAAELLGISPATADRYWAYARAWLHNRIRGGA